MFIKGLANLEAFEKKNLQNMKITTIEGIATVKEEILEIFEIEISAKEKGIKEIRFNDLNLSILDVFISMNIIGIKDNSDGVFLTYENSKLVHLKNFLSIKRAYISIIEATFRLENKKNIIYNIVLAIDIVKDENIENRKNPSEECRKGKVYKWELLFDKEFI